MPIYSYKGIDPTGKEQKGTVTSETIVQAKQKVKNMGIMLMDMQEQNADALKKKSISIGFGPTIKTEDLALMTRQLSTLIKAKVQLVESLSALTDQMEKPQMKVILSEIKQKVNEGSSLAGALKDYPKVFSNVYVNMVEAGEQSGTLDVVLLRLADFTEAQVRLQRKVKGAMLYPVIMAFFGMAMMSVIFVFVIPKITKIFVNMKKELPLPTKISIWVSDRLIEDWYWIIALVILIYWGFNTYIESESGKRKWHAFQLRAPVVGELVMMVNVSRFCSSLATLLNSGVPILTALTIVKNLIGNVHLQEAVQTSRDRVSEGGSMTDPLIKSGHFPALVTHMIKLGERSGELEPMLKIVADNYEEQVDTRLNGLTSVLEPIMMLGLGGMVALIVASVIIPMMELNTIK